MANANGYVTWKNLLTVVTIGVIIAIAFSTATSVLQGQARDEFKDSMLREFANVREQLKDIKTRLPR